MNDRTRAHVFVSGRVQGVFFRAHTRQTATDLGIDGWVRNLPDGRVEAVFEGQPAAVDTMIDWCAEGSPKAVVNEVEVTYETPEGISGFDIHR